MNFETPKGSKAPLVKFIKQINDPQIVTTCSDYNRYNEYYRVLLVAVLVRAILQTSAENIDYISRQYSRWESGLDMCFIRSERSDPKINIIVLEYELGFVLYQFNNDNGSWLFIKKEYIQKHRYTGTEYFIQ